MVGWYVGDSALDQLDIRDIDVAILRQWKVIVSLSSSHARLFSGCQDRKGV